MRKPANLKDVPLNRSSEFGGPACDGETAGCGQQPLAALSLRPLIDGGGHAMIGAGPGHGKRRKGAIMMNTGRWRAAALAAALSLAAAPASSQTANQAVEPWPPERMPMPLDPDELRTVAWSPDPQPDMYACQPQGEADFQACLAEAMRRGGASPAAIKAAAAMDYRGYISQAGAEGTVISGFLTPFPYPADIAGFQVLLNGRELFLAPMPELRPILAGFGLRAQIFGVDSALAGYSVSADGGGQFLYRETIRDCRGCEPRGHLAYRVDFDRAGDLRGTRLIEARAGAAE